MITQLKIQQFDVTENTYNFFRFLLDFFRFQLSYNSGEKIKASKINDIMDSHVV